MKIKKLKAHQKVSLDLQSKPSRFVIETAKTDPKLPALFAFCGSRGSGKTYACVAMCSHFEKMGYITRTFLICPTRASNSIYSNLETLDEERDVCDQESHCQLALQNIIKEVKKDWHAYDFEQKYAKLYKKWKKNPYIINIVEEKILNDQGHRKPEHLPRPAHMLIVDDCQGTGMYSDAKRDLMKHVTIKHRHIPLVHMFPGPILGRLATHHSAQCHAFHHLQNGRHQATETDLRAFWDVCDLGQVRGNVQVRHVQTPWVLVHRYGSQEGLHEVQERLRRVLIK
jgi:hypothetical protein